MNTAAFNLKQLFNNRQTRIQASIAFLVLVIGFVLSFAGFVELQAVARERLYLETQHRIEVQLKQIQSNVNISLSSLADISALYPVNKGISRAQVSNYILSNRKYHSATLALGWVPRVLGKDVDLFETEIRKSNPDFYVYEVSGHGLPIPSNQQEVIFPIEVVISSENKKLRTGLNLGSIASRRYVMDKAERIENTAITQSIGINTPTKRIYGFQAFHPVIDQNDLGQPQLAGFILGVYDTESLIEDVFLEASKQFDIAIYDANTSSQQVLYSSTEQLDTVNEVKQQKRQHWTYTLNVADQQWLVEIFPKLKEMMGTTAWLPYIGLIMGGLITALLMLYLFVSLTKARQFARLSTDLAGTEAQLDIQTALKQEADKANRAKSGLLQAASHDLRQPLHTIGLLTSLLKDSKDKNEQSLLIDKTLSAVEGMDAMFGSLLDVSLLESNDLQVHLQHFFLQDILDKLAIGFELQAEKKGLSFSIIETSMCVYTDPVLLERILRSLLSNAIRYTPQGKVLLGCRHLKNHLRICVLDTGIGFNDEDKDKIFDSFYRDKQAQQLTDNGLGLGLSIVKEMASLLKLNIGVRSQLGKGSLFYIEVPKGEPSLLGEITQTEQNSSINKLIWIIEDNESTRFGLEKLLQSWQCKTESLASGQELQPLFDDNVKQPEIIIADYQLINETGLDLILTIREHYDYQIPAIIITGTTDLTTRKLIEQAECSFMMKPVSPNVLNTML